MGPDMAQKSIPELHPHEPEIENRVITSILSDPDDRKIVLDNLSEEHFFNTFNKIVFRKCWEMQSNGHPVEPATIWEALDNKEKEIVGHLSKIAALQENIPVSTDIRYHIKILKEYESRRQIFEQCNAIQKDLNKKKSLSQIKVKAERIAEAAGMQAECDYNGKNLFQFFSFEQLFTEEIKPLPAIVEGMVFEDDLTVFHGKGGVGKSILAQDIAMAVGCNMPELWGLFKIPRWRCSLFIQSENSRNAFEIRISKKCDGDLEFLKGLPNIGCLGIFDNLQIAGDVTDEKFKSKLVRSIKYIEEQNQVKFDQIFFDPLISFHAGDENDNSHMRDTLNAIILIGNEIKATPLIIAHDNRKGELRGAQAIWDCARNIIKLEDFSYRGNTRIKLIHEKSNNSALFETFILQMNDTFNFEHLELEDAIPKKKKERCLQVKEALELLGGETESKEILSDQYEQVSGVSAKTTRYRHIDETVENGFINCEPYQEKGLTKYRYFEAK